MAASKAEHEGKESDRGGHEKTDQPSRGNESVAPSKANRNHPNQDGNDGEVEPDRTEKARLRGE